MHCVVAQGEGLPPLDTCNGNGEIIYFYVNVCCSFVTIMLYGPIISAMTILRLLVYFIVLPFGSYLSDF